MPGAPLMGDLYTRSISWDNLPASFRTSSWSPLMTASPAESYPRYSSLFRPLRMIGVASRGPIYPTIPHIGDPPKFDIRHCEERLALAMTVSYCHSLLLCPRDCWRGVIRKVYFRRERETGDG